MIRNPKRLLSVLAVSILVPSAVGVYTATDSGLNTAPLSRRNAMTVRVVDTSGHESSSLFRHVPVDPSIRYLKAQVRPACDGRRVSSNNGRTEIARMLSLIGVSWGTTVHAQACSCCEWVVNVSCAQECGGQYWNGITEPSSWTGFTWELTACANAGNPTECNTTEPWAETCSGGCLPCG